MILDEGRVEGEARGRVEGEARGRVEGARAVLLHLGTRRFGPPDSRVRLALEAIDDPEQSDRLFEVGSWDKLLAAP